MRPPIPRHRAAIGVEIHQPLPEIQRVRLDREIMGISGASAPLERINDAPLPASGFHISQQSRKAARLRCQRDDNLASDTQLAKCRVLDRPHRPERDRPLEDVEPRVSEHNPRGRVEPSIAGDQPAGDQIAAFLTWQTEGRQCRNRQGPAPVIFCARSRGERQFRHGIQW